MQRSKPKVLRYELPGGWTLIVGATDASNDYVSTVLAEPEDWWFHADQVPGSHVLLKAKPDELPSRAVLRQAAAVAAYHSKARNAQAVRVYCTRAARVRKPRGAPAGTVQVTAGKVLVVRPELGFAVRKEGA